MPPVSNQVSNQSSLEVAGIFAIAVSALIVLLLAIGAVPPKDVIWACGVNTVVGGALALLAYWLWPTWERTRVSERIAEMLNAYRNYTHALSHWNSTDKFRMQELEHARRDARAPAQISKLPSTAWVLSPAPGESSSPV
jgi:uncharacterized membrane protein YccC